MMTSQRLLDSFSRIAAAARAAADGQLCAVAPHPDLRARIRTAVRAGLGTAGLAQALRIRIATPQSLGLNDGVIFPPQDYALDTPLAAIRQAAGRRAPLRGVLRVIVVLVDFDDRVMEQTQDHYRDLFFSRGVIATKSVREYFDDVTGGLIDLDGEVVGPLRLPKSLEEYAHGESGLSLNEPNAATMADDAVSAANPLIDFAPYDNDDNGYVDAFIVLHAGQGAEVTGSDSDIWSHKWVLPAGARRVDGAKIYAYLTVPEDSKIGVCAHELGHLVFGFPDLYDSDGSSEGIGNWCLMAGGSWGGGGDTPVHPSAWCKANQGWVEVATPHPDAQLTIDDVKSSRTVYQLWADGAAGTEYFLMENRQQDGFDATLPGSGLLIWHIDESQSGNTDDRHYKVALMQADGKADLEAGRNRGDAGDAYPGTADNREFTATSTPGSKSYAGADSCVGVTQISDPGPTMTANVSLSCPALAAGDA